ncbi:MAG: hypothetical protein AAFY57_08745 [Cyanobacteria bacterium J06642_2]
MSLLSEIALVTASIFWAVMWAYATLLILYAFLEDTDSIYFQPMRMSLDRFVDTLGMGWLKPLHEMNVAQRRAISYGLFVLVTIGVGLLLWSAK